MSNNERTMKRLDYQHLMHFWMVAKHGSIARASEELNLAQATISGHLRDFESNMGETLFHRTGRSLELTEVGNVVFRYAEDIFSLGRELQDTLRGHATGRPLRLRVGISDAMPKLVSHRLLQPVLAIEEPFRLVCRVGKTERLLAELSIQGLDLVLADEPITGPVRVKAFNHQLGECGVTFFATSKSTRKYRKAFPTSLDGAPMLLPTPNTLLRRRLDLWFESLDIQPSIVAEYEDSGLLEAAAHEGAGIFAAPSAIAEEITSLYGVRTIGSTDDIKERFYAITVERRIKNPAVMAIAQGAREELFGPKPTA